MKRYRQIIPVTLVFFLGQVLFGSSLKLPSILGDHMVLQQNSQVNIWGWAGAGDLVKVTTGWNDQVYSTTADPDGGWMVRIRTGIAGGPHQLTIESDSTIVLDDILLGEVWICSGQSNMELPLRRAESASTEIPRSINTKLRLFTVEKIIATRPKDDVQGNWVRCGPGTTRDFSAVGYFFGKYLQQDLEVPVGLIHTSWGGTPSEAWTSRETLEQFGYFYGELQRLYETELVGQDLAEKEREEIQKEINAKSDFFNPGNIGYKNHWMKAEYDDSDWLKVPCPAEWSSVDEIGMLEGVAWMRTRVYIPEGWIGKPLVIELGPVDEMDATYFNGQKIGFSHKIENWDIPRTYTVPGHMVETKECVLAIRIVNTLAEGGLVGVSEQLKIYPAGDVGTDAVKLAGTWKFKVAYEFPKLPVQTNPKSSTVLYNGMIHPLIKMTIKGAIWYQGEANTARAYQYRDIFPSMIDDWRSKWDQGDFPFYFVQIAPYKYNTAFEGAELREAQLLTLSRVKNCGMAVTLDIGNPNDIHPVNKRDVGKRLALWALAKDYGRDLTYSGPLYREQKIEGSSIRIFFDHTGDGLEARGGPPTYFEIAGSDKIYHQATASIDGHTVLVSSDHVTSPVNVRYGWRNTAEPNLYNKDGLPASSFCTDNWPRVTEPVAGE